MAGGDNWDSPASRLETERGRALHDTLVTYRPRRVLEIGPGGGFFTKMVCEFDSVEEYWAVDINDAFLKYLEPRIEHLKSKRPGLKAVFRAGDVVSLPLPEGHFDLIFLFSTVHHIPNRAQLFKGFARTLAHDGHILTFDPSHYLPRWLKLIRCMPSYLRRSFYTKIENLSTHHMCSKGEYRKLMRQTGSLSVEKFFWKWPRKIEENRVLPDVVKPLLFPFSHEIGMLGRKR